MDFSRRRSIFLFFAIFSAFLFLASVSVIDACTLWSAAGSRVAHKGSLIAKNRDWTPEPSVFRLVQPQVGFRSLGLFPIRDGKQQGLVAGVNEKGLVVVTASASSIPEADRGKGGSGLARQLLTLFSTVEEVQLNKSVFARTHPVIFLIADRSQTAWIEVAPEGKFALRASKKGVLTHTNHYLDKTLIDANKKIGRSSRTRLGRIGELLDGHPAAIHSGGFHRLQSRPQRRTGRQPLADGGKTGWNKDPGQLDRFPPAGGPAGALFQAGQSRRT